jgi:hypothetical protein
VNRKQNQLIRGVVAALIVVAYIARLVTVGNGDVMILGYRMTVISLIAIRRSVIAGHTPCDS